MPDLAGIWRPGAESGALAGILEAQLATLGTQARPYESYRMSRRGCAAGLLDHGIFENGEQPARSADGRWLLLLDGEIQNLEELRSRHRLRAAREPRSAAGQCVELIARRGLEVIAELNGLFALVLWDEQEESLYLVSDRFGFRPLFFRERPGELLFATELKGILAADRGTPGFDATAVCELLVYGSHFMGRTWLEGCQRLAPATILCANAQGISSRRYWHYRYTEGGKALDQATYITNFARLFDRAVARCMRGQKRIGIFLSAGYDSRSVAAAIPRHHLPLPAFTFGEPQSRDVRLAPLLAERIGLEHHYLQGTKPFLRQLAGPIVWRTEGMLPFAGTTSVRFHDVLRTHADIILTGFLAEFSGSHVWPALLRTRSRRGAITAIFDRFVAGRLPRARSVLRPEVFARAEEELRVRFAASFEQVQNEHPLNIADAWNLLCLQPGGTYQSPAVDRHLMEIRAPHMDAELVEFLLTIAPLARIEQRIYKRMIAYSFPAIRDVPCANSMQPIEPRFWVEYPKMVGRFVGRRVSQPLLRMLGRGAGLGREISDPDADFRAEPQLRDELLLPLLDSGHLPPEVFSHDAIRNLVAAQYGSDARHAPLLASLISLGLANRLLVHRDVREVPAFYRTLAAVREAALERS